MTTFHERAARRAALSPGAAVGVTEELIETLVPTFYGKVRRDPLIGPVFEAAVDDWPEHLSKLCDFWSSVVLMTGRFRGAPMAAHVKLPGVGEGHFARWLELWRETAHEVCPAPAAELFVQKAEMIGRSLQLGIAASRGELPPLR